MSVRHVETLPTVDGGSLQWEFADPGRLLSLLVQDVPQVQGLFAEVGIEKRCTLIRSGETMTKPTSWFDHRLYNLCEAMRVLITRCIYNVKATAAAARSDEQDVYDMCNFSISSQGCDPPPTE
jgi:hypothetical protein